MKQIIIKTVSIISIITFLFINPVVIYAQTVSPSISSAVNPQKLADRISAEKQRGDTLINDRLTKLNNMLSKITAAKKLSATDKSAFSAKIQANITGLTNLKAKIDADTDAATLKADIKSIFTDYRVYAVFAPQTGELAAADAMTEAADTLSALADTLASRIQQARTAGKDMSSLQTLLTDMKAKIADAKTQYANVESQVAGLAPSSYPSSTAILQSARTMLKTGRQDLQTALQDAKQIRQGLQALGGKPTVSPNPTQ